MSTAIDTDLLREVEQFLYREARYADASDYEAWEDLWTDDAIYWIPAGGDDIDPTKTMSIVFDNRSRIATRVKQFGTGKRHAQAPPSRVARIIGNVELLDTDPEYPEDIVVAATFQILESRERGMTHWAGHYRYRLRHVDGELKMAYKKVMLVDNERAIYTLAFIV